MQESFRKRILYVKNMYFQVTKHITLKTFGTSMISLDAELQQMMNVSINNIRPKIAKPTTDEIFITNQGEKMTNSSFATCISTAWQQVMNRGNMCANLLRKATVVHVSLDV